jgi:hypothetical protein
LNATTQLIPLNSIANRHRTVSPWVAEVVYCEDRHQGLSYALVVGLHRTGITRPLHLHRIYLEYTGRAANVAGDAAPDPADLDRGSLIETSASAQLIAEHASLCELIRAKSHQRLRLRFVLTHDLKRDAELRDRPLSCRGIAASLRQKREGVGHAERDCRPVKLAVLAGQVAERLAESDDRLVQTDGTDLPGTEVTKRVAKTFASVDLFWQRQMRLFAECSAESQNGGFYHGRIIPASAENQEREAESALNPCPVEWCALARALLKARRDTPRPPPRSSRYRRW